jgi:ribosomal protein L19
MRSDKQHYQTLGGYSRPVRAQYRVKLKNRLVFSTRFEELEYIYSSVGRCLSARSRGKMASLHIRNISYGVEQRLFVSNPRVIFEYF